jgi:hypothetical protein
MAEKIADLTTEQLKARAYDLLAIMESCKEQLVAINNEIIKRPVDKPIELNK